MSEFLNRTKITALERSNAELVSENAELKAEIGKLKAEIALFSGKDLDIIELEDIVLEDKNHDETNLLREKIAEDKRKLTANCTIAFLLGILITMAVWVVTGYQNSWQTYLSFWK